MSTLSHAGWVIGLDSDINGVLKVSRDMNTQVIKLEKCENIYSQCELIESKSNFSVNVSQFFNHIQTGSAALGNILPAVAGGVIALSPVGWYGAGTIALEFAGGSIVTYAGTKLITIPKSLNVVRLYDYSSIYFDSFLEDDTSIVAFPEDTIAQIVSELI